MTLDHKLRCVDCRVVFTMDDVVAADACSSCGSERNPAIEMGYQEFMVEASLVDYRWVNHLRRCISFPSKN